MQLRHWRDLYMYNVKHRQEDAKKLLIVIFSLPVQLWQNQTGLAMSIKLLIS
jgi:hypothetical protein